MNNSNEQKERLGKLTLARRPRSTDPPDSCLSSWARESYEYKQTHYGGDWCMKTRRMEGKWSWPERRFERRSRGEERERWFFHCCWIVVPWWICGGWICEGRRRRRKKEEIEERKLKIKRKFIII